MTTYTSSSPQKYHGGANGQNEFSGHKKDGEEEKEKDKRL